MPRQIPNPAPEALAQALGHALQGTHGRAVSVESLRSLVEIEVQDWSTQVDAPAPGATIDVSSPALMAHGWSLKDPKA